MLPYTLSLCLSFSLLLLFFPSLHPPLFLIPPPPQCYLKFSSPLSSLNYNFESTGYSEDESVRNGSNEITQNNILEILIAPTCSSGAQKLTPRSKQRCPLCCNFFCAQYQSVSCGTSPCSGQTNEMETEALYLHQGAVWAAIAA